MTLGLDIGLKGIGICVRKGSSVIYAKTLLFDLPPQNLLAERRLRRASRRARKNRDVRMSRLKRLFEAHGLPWVDENDPAFQRTDPFELRHRALTHGIASPYALAICLRHVVKFRGYDFYSQSEGEYPWGEDSTLAKARQWLASSFVDDEVAERLREWSEELEGSPKHRDEFIMLIQERIEWSRTHSIASVLQSYVGNTKRNQREKARGHNFPRRMVEQHLRELITRNAAHLSDPDGFTAALFRPCVSKEDREAAIFYYQRKTPEEAAKHFAKKQAKCPLAKALGLGDDLPRGFAGDEDIRRWNLIEFLVHRRFEYAAGDASGNELKHITGSALENIITIALAGGKRAFGDAKKLVGTCHGKGWSLVKDGTWNAGQFKQLKDLVQPTIAAKKRKVSLSVAAATELLRLVCPPGEPMEPEAIRNRIKKTDLYTIRGNLMLDYGVFPQVECLLGRPAKGGTPGFAVKGFLQQLFEQELADQLGGKAAPDYCVIETARDVPRSKREAMERDRELAIRREEKDERTRAYGFDPGALGRWGAMRLRLHQQQGGICPFTGIELPVDPMDGSLELAHLFPDSRGGLAVEDNLVITTRTVNKAMAERSPKEAAAARIPGWLSWAQMIEITKAFRWPASKRAIFAFEPNAQIPVPDFGNLTRTSQLARQLVRMAQLWMGVGEDEAARRERIGMPHGALTAAARRSWLPQWDKPRSVLSHHLLDAAILSFIPPGGGLNSTANRGIFRSVQVEKSTPGGLRPFPVIRALTGLAPDLSHLLEEDPHSCPIVKRRSDSRHRSIGDSTFWSVDLHTGQTSQRTPLVPGSKELKSLDGHGLLALLRRMGIPDQKIPAASDLDRWLAATTDPHSPVPELKLRDGTPVKSIRKFGGKGNLANPIGWGGITGANGVLDQVRSVAIKFAECRLLLGWNPMKLRWEYTRFLIPDRRALAQLSRFGWRWTSSHGLPPFLQDELRKSGCRSLEELICGKRLPYSRQVATFRRGDTFRVPLNAKGKLELTPALEVWRTWFETSAINASGKIEMSCLTHSDASNTPLHTSAPDWNGVFEVSSPSSLASLAGLPGDAAANAMTMGLRDPSPP